MSWFLFFWVVLKAILFSTGGFGPLPALHADFIANGWATEQQFAEALSIGQITPGPNGLWVVSLCYLVAGIPGAIMSAIALIMPPFFVVLVQYCYARINHISTIQGILDGVVLVISSFTVIVLAGVFKNSGIDVTLLIIAAVSAILAATRRVSVNLILIVAALFGAMFGGQ